LSKTLPVIIVAGGLATRLGDVAKAVPKAMVEVAGKPFIAHQLNLLSASGIKEVVLCVSHLSDQIENFVGDGSQFALKVKYAHDGPVRLGTGGSVKKALDLVSDPFAVLYGDTYLDIKYAPVFRTFKDSGKQGLMTVMLNEDQWDKSNVLYRDGKIITYNKWHPTDDMKHIDYGLSVFKRACFEAYPENTGFDLADVFERLIDLEQLA